MGKHEISCKKWEKKNKLYHYEEEKFLRMLRTFYPETLVSRDLCEVSEMESTRWIGKPEKNICHACVIVLTARLIITSYSRIGLFVILNLYLTGPYIASSGKIVLCAKNVFTTKEDYTYVTFPQISELL